MSCLFSGFIKYNRCLNVPSTTAQMLYGRVTENKLVFGDPCRIIDQCNGHCSACNRGEAYKIMRVCLINAETLQK